MLNYETGKATHLQRFPLGNNRVIPAMIVLVDYLWCSPKRGNGRAGRRVPFVTSTPQTICLRAPKIIQYTATKSREQCSRVASTVSSRRGWVPVPVTPHPFQLCPIATSIKFELHRLLWASFFFFALKSSGKENRLENRPFQIRCKFSCGVA
jgi:hypothetical protein